MSWNRKDWLKFAGLLGLGATGAGAAGIGPLAGLLGGATEAVPMAAMGGTAASAASQAISPVGQAMSALSGASGAINKAAPALGVARGLLGGEPQPPMAPPPPSQFQPTPVASPYGGINDQPPPGIDPRQWAMMTPEQKRRIKGGMV